MVSGVYWNHPVCLRLPVCPFTNPPLYEILVILCCKPVLQFTSVVLKVCWYIDHNINTEVVQDAVFNYLLPIGQGLSPLELKEILLNCLFLSKYRRGIKADSVTPLVSNVFYLHFYFPTLQVIYMPRSIHRKVSFSLRTRYEMEDWCHLYNIVLSFCNIFPVDENSSRRFDLSLTLYQMTNLFSYPNWKHSQTTK